VTQNPEPIFIKSSFSNASGDCVEVAKTADGGRLVRDSKDRAGGTLTFTESEWRAFLQGAEAGEFN
jgi:hypothetical protein